ncbi:MAG: carboxypeptidase-like regulatory domain-containing protein [Bacteroidota bacterium]
MKKAALMCSMLLFVWAAVWAQTLKVAGKVTDASGNGLEGASVSVKGKPAGTITNSVGDYSLSVQKGETLVFSGVGLETQEVKADGSAVSVQMKAINTNLSEVVVVGYGQQKKAAITGSVVTLKQEDLLKRQVATASNLL